ncbi:MAG: GNAT family N-acetyltransferase [Planctomycetes bacterium]|nr:GNAT family N-acetyltransferase [Planctomycetota bacterium]
MIDYSKDVAALTPDDLHGFFQGWPDPPDRRTHLALLRGSAEAIVAYDEESSRVVGFVTAISDGVLSAYLPLLEVLPDFRGRGIGRELVKRMLERLEHCYMVDVVCDEGVLPFYEALGLRAGHAAMHRNYARQSGRNAGGAR